MPRPPARVFLVEPDLDLRSRMREMLDAFPSIVVVGEAGSPDGVRKELPSTSSHVVVLSGRPQTDATEICRFMRESLRDAALLVRTSQVSDELLRAARGGVAEFVSEEAKVVDFLWALDRVADQRATGLAWSGGLGEDPRLLRTLPPSLAGMLSRR